MAARRIVVLGAGIVGVASAHALAGRGAEVTLVDQAPGPATGTSAANGGQLSYSYVAPLADPGVLRDLPHYLFDRDSPLRLRPRLDPGQWAFCLRFLLACRRQVADATTARLLALAERSRASLHAIMERTAIAFDHNATGKVVVLGSVAAVESARRQVALQATLGSVQELVGVERALEIEPALAAMRARIAGAVFTPGEEAGDCAAFTRKLCQFLEPSVAMRFGERVDRIVVQGGQVAAVVTDKGEIACDDVVVALGVDSAGLVRRHGVSLPVYPLKGYSITARIVEPARAPSASVTDAANKTVYARLGDRLRVAGFVEIVGYDRVIDPARIRRLVETAQSAFPGAIDPASLEPWAGRRPATATGRPIIGATRVKGLWTNVGQGALGWTLACGSADELADAMFPA